MNSRSAGSEIQRSSPVRSRSATTLLRVLLADLQPCPDHLRERPVAHPLAVRQAAPGVPEHVSGEAVDVLEELPGEAGLADAGDARDEHESGRAALCRGVEELLDEVEARGRAR